MPGVARIGDGTITAHTCSPETTVLTGSPNVFVNNKAVAFQGSFLTLHLIQSGDNCVPHPAQTITGGLGTVLVNNNPIARLGDATSCSPGASVVEGSADVFAG